MINKTTDFTALDGIKPITGIKGYSVFTQEEGRRIRAFYLANRTTEGDIGRYLGVCARTIRNVIQRSHKYTRPRRFTKELVARIHARHMAGESIFALGKEYSCKIALYFRRDGLEYTTIYRDLEERDKQIAALIKRGVKQDEIIAMTGLNAKQVNRSRTRIRATMALTGRMQCRTK